MKRVNVQNGFLVALLAVVLAGGSLFAAVSPAKQLEKGKQLFAQEKNEEAMDAFIEVLVNGSRAEVEEANSYINRIHNRLGGIQDPVEVDVNYQEGAVVRLPEGVDPVAFQEQLDAEMKPIEQELRAAGLTATAQADQAAMTAQEQAQAAASQWSQQQQAARTAWQQKVDEYSLEEAALQAQLDQDAQALRAAAQDIAGQAGSSTYTDLTSASALQARQLYTTQKLDSLKQVAIAKLEKEKGVRLYFRNGEPDAIDIDSEVLFDGNKFRTDALPLLDEVYTLMALTQGAGYVILPPGSYTDNITLSGIRQAMALNSFLVHKGLSSGKISYNMGLFDQEPPAKFANLEGISIVFDYDADLPALLPEAAAVSKLPLLSMAVVPVSNKIDPSAGEAFAIDFSVIETVNPVDNWVFQVVQHGADNTYYVVRQLEGFSPVYHQLLWNGRKGIIGPELACGRYTLVLTAADVQGGKRTLRRLVEVACTNQKAVASKTAVSVSSAKDNLNYKTPRLWTKPGREMRNVVTTTVVTTEETEMVDPMAASSADQVQQTTTTDTYYNVDTQNQASAADNNPFDMPYEQM